MVLDQLQPIADVFGLGEDIVMFVGIALVAGVVLFFTIMVPILRLVLEISPFAYPNARIRGMQSKLLPAARLEELLEMPAIMEIFAYLEGSDYEAHIARIEGDKTVEAVENALNNCLAETYAKVIGMAPTCVASIFKSIVLQWESRNLKAVLRALYAGVPVKEVSHGLVPIGHFTQEDLESFYDLRSVEELVSKLEDTEYGPVLGEAMTQYTETGSIQPLEVALDQYVYQRLWRSVESQSEENAHNLKTFFGKEIDVKNIKTLLRAKVDGIPTEAVKPLALPMGFELNVDQIESLAEAKDVEGVLAGLEGTSYGAMLMEALPEYDSTKSLLPFEKALDTYLAKAARAISNSQPFGVGPLIGYLSSKDVEVRNLRCIIRGIGAGLSPDRMKGLLVEV